jgi:hypothetical protein
MDLRVPLRKGQEKAHGVDSPSWGRMALITANELEKFNVLISPLRVDVLVL